MLEFAAADDEPFEPEDADWELVPPPSFGALPVQAHPSATTSVRNLMNRERIVRVAIGDDAHGSAIPAEIATLLEAGARCVTSFRPSNVYCLVLPFIRAAEDRLAFLAFSICLALSTARAPARTNVEHPEPAGGTALHAGAGVGSTWKNGPSDDDRRLHSAA